MNSSMSVTQQISVGPVKANVALNSLGRIYTAVVANTDDIFRDAFALRYESYFESGFVEANPAKSFQDEFDYLPNSTVIVVYENDHPVASVRVCFASRRQRNFPAYHAFKHEVDAMLQQIEQCQSDFEVAEITRLVRSPGSANNQGLVFLLYRLAGHLVLKNDIQAILCSVRRNHVGFYHRLGFVNVAGPSDYPGLTCQMHLLSCTRTSYDATRRAFSLMNPEVAPAGTFDGFASGRPISMPLSFVA
jgi:hypothetical protein